MNYNYAHYHSSNFYNRYFLEALSKDLVKAIKEDDISQLAFTLRNIVVASLREHQSSTIADDHNLKYNLSRVIVDSLRQNLLAQQDLTGMLLEQVISEHFQNALDQGVAQVVQTYMGRLKSLEVVLADVLKLYGATALVSNDPEVRKQAEELLKSHKIDIDQLLKDTNL
jgi:hypothetical protein